MRRYDHENFEWSAEMRMAMTSLFGLRDFRFAQARPSYFKLLSYVAQATESA